MTCGMLVACRRALRPLFRVPASTAFSIRAFRFRNLRKAAARVSPRRRRRRRTFQSVRAVFWPLVPTTTAPATSTTEGSEAARGSVPAPQTVVHETLVIAPVSSPETSAYLKVVARLRSAERSTASGGGEDDDKEKEACRSFESCLMEMLVEVGKARDLQDVEELLRCWERLKSPVFVELVCRFYGELCNDLFPAAGFDEVDIGRGGDGSKSMSPA